MQDRPTARELLQAVAEFLEREINPTLSDPRLRFRGLIAVNVLAIVARELAAGEAHLRDEWGRLVQLLGKSDRELPSDVERLRDEIRTLTRELCARIRAGELDASPEYDEALAHAQATVVEKLEIANPRYLERVQMEKTE